VRYLEGKMEFNPIQPMKDESLNAPQEKPKKRSKLENKLEKVQDVITSLRDNPNFGKSSNKEFNEKIIKELGTKDFSLGIRTISAQIGKGIRRNQDIGREKEQLQLALQSYEEKLKEELEGLIKQENVQPLTELEIPKKEIKRPREGSDVYTEKPGKIARKTIQENRQPPAKLEVPLQGIKRPRSEIGSLGEYTGKPYKIARTTITESLRGYGEFVRSSIGNVYQAFSLEKVRGVEMKLGGAILFAKTAYDVGNIILNEPSALIDLELLAGASIALGCAAYAYKKGGEIIQRSNRMDIESPSSTIQESIIAKDKPIDKKHIMTIADLNK
jgi:hypothetical protein